MAAFQAGSVTAKFLADIKDFKKQMKVIDKALSAFNVKATRGFKKMNSASKKIADSFKKIETKATKAIKESKNFGRALDVASVKGVSSLKMLDSQMDKLAISTAMMVSTANSQRFTFINSLKSGIQSLTGSIKPHTRNIMNNLSKLARGVQDKIKAGLTQIINMTKTTALAIGGAVVAIGTFGMNVARNTEMSRASFEALLGSAEKARDVMFELTDFAKKTPFNLADSRKYAENLLAIGIEQENLIPTLDMLGNLARGDAGKFSRLQLAFGQVKTATKLTGAELRQFTENGVPLVDLLAKDMKISAQQVREEIAKGSVTFGRVDKVLGNFAKTTGSMDAASKTFNGRLSNLQDSLSLTAMKMVGVNEAGEVMEGGIFDLVSKGLMVFADWVDKNEEKIVSLTQSMINGFREFAEKVWPKVQSGLKDFAEKVWPKVQSGLKDFAEKAWPKVQSGLKDFAEKAWPKVQSAFQTMYDLIVRVFNWARDNQSILTSLAIGVGIVASALAILNVAIGVFMVVTSPVTLIIAGIVLALVAITTAVVHLWRTNDKFKIAVIAIWEVVKNTFSTMVTWITEKVEAVKTIFSGITDFVTGVFKGDFEQAWEGIETAFGGVYDFFKADIDAIISLIDGIIDPIQKAIDKFNELTGKANESIPIDPGGISKGFKVNIPKIPLTNPFKAAGGPVMAGQPYVVGERGPELFTPQSSGQITNNTNMNQSNNFNVSGAGNPEAVARLVMSMLAKQNNLAFNGVNL